VSRGDQLRVDANQVPELAYASFQDIADTELPADITDIDVLAAISKRGFTRESPAVLWIFPL
jgi:hypothetical protein